MPASPKRSFWSSITYFTPKELGDPTGTKMDELLVTMLDQARRYAGIPFTITSGYRTPEKNKIIGGAKNSAHLEGKAVDIATPTAQTRYTILKAVMAVGFDRIEIAPRHIHVDVAHDDLHPARWLGVLDTKTGVIA